MPLVHQSVQELTDRDFPAAVLRSQLPVVVEFYYEGWETPWRALTSEAWAALQTRERVRTAALDTGKNRAIATRYGVETIPQVFVFRGGEVVARFMGRTRAQDVSAALERARRAAPVGDGKQGGIPAAHRPHAKRERIARREPALARAG